MVDDYAGYKAMFAPGITELACLAHVRRDWHAWLLSTHKTVSPGSGTAKAIDYALKRWPALLRFAKLERDAVDMCNTSRQPG